MIVGFVQETFLEFFKVEPENFVTVNNENFMIFDDKKLIGNVDIFVFSAFRSALVEADKKSAGSIRGGSVVEFEFFEVCC